MFDGVGRNLDEERGARSAWAAGAVAVAASALAVALLAPSRSPEPPPPPELDAMVLLFDVPNEPDAPWELPPPPPPEPAGPEEGEVDTGLGMDTAIPGLEPDSDVEGDTRGGEGDTGGEPDGEPDGEAGGAIGREPTVSGPEPSPRPRGAPGAAPEQVWDIPLRNRLRAKYPPVARRQELGDVTCRMVAWVDRDGEARRVEPLACPPAFRAQARVALMEATWESFDAPDTNTWRRVEMDIPFEM